MFDVNNNLYSTLPASVILHKFSHLTIAFDPAWKRIAINLSGGADSALLAVLLCKIISKHSLDTKVDVITFQRCWETRPWQGHVSLQIFNKIKEMYPNIIQNRYTTYIPPEIEHGAIGPVINGKSGDQIIVGSFNSASSVL